MVYKLLGNHSFALDVRNCTYIWLSAGQASHCCSMLLLPFGSFWLALCNIQQSLNVCSCYLAVIKAEPERKDREGHSHLLLIGADLSGACYHIAHALQLWLYQRHWNLLALQDNHKHPKVLFLCNDCMYRLVSIAPKSRTHWFGEHSAVCPVTGSS